MQDLGFLSWKMREKKMPAIAFIDSDLESLCFFEIYINIYIYKREQELQSPSRFMIPI